MLKSLDLFYLSHFLNSIPDTAGFKINKLKSNPLRK